MGVAFYTQGGLFVDDVLISSNLSLHVHLGNSVKKSGILGSLSGQFAQLRSYFTSNAASPPFSDVLAGTIPLIVHVNQADQINSVLRFKQEMNIPQVVILGGAEAHVLASRLAVANVSVILAPPRAAPDSAETWYVLKD